MPSHKKILVLGASGMLGHKLMQRLGTCFEVQGTVRKAAEQYRKYSALAGASLIPFVEAQRPESLASAIAMAAPDVVINCVGVIKQLKEAKDPLIAIQVNAMLPHQLAVLCSASKARLIHFSTDCVFSGRKGNYTEEDIPDATDLYGRTKLLGEVTGPGCLTLRTSIIGRELERGSSLIEWFLSQRGARVRGFVRALYTGLTTIAMANLVGEVVADSPDLEGLWHVSSDPISKYELLHLVNRVYNLGIEIERDEEFVCDRRLDSTRFRERTGFRPLPWEQMIQDMFDDPTPYVH